MGQNGEEGRQCGRAENGCSVNWAFVPSMLWIAFIACIGIAALAVGVQPWLLKRLSIVEQWVMIVCGLALISPAPAADAVGLVGIAAVLAWPWFGRKTVARAWG